MRIFATFLLLISMTLTGGCSNPPTDAPPNQEPPVPSPTPDPTPDIPDVNDITVDEQALIDAHNLARDEMPGLVAHPQLMEVARKQADWMALNMDMTHDRPKKFSNRVVDSGYRGAAGENIAMGYSTTAAVMTGWMNSTGHRRNILGTWEHIGVAVTRDDRGRCWWCAVFGSQSYGAKGYVVVAEGATPPGISEETEE